MIKRAAIGILVVLVAFAVVVSLRPADYHVERSTMISAPPAVVFAYVNDVRKFQQFSPWSKRDPSMKMTYSEPPSGTGAAFSWAGNAEVGEGRMTISDSRANEFVRFHLEFIKPFAGSASAQFAFQPQGDQTRVTWSMSGQNNFVAKAIGLFLDMDKMIGGDFENGLAGLKTLAEKP